MAILSYTISRCTRISNQCYSWPTWKDALLYLDYTTSQLAMQLSPSNCLPHMQNLYKLQIVGRSHYRRVRYKYKNRNLRVREMRDWDHNTLHFVEILWGLLGISGQCQWCREPASVFAAQNYHILWYFIIIISRLYNYLTRNWLVLVICYF